MATRESDNLESLQVLLQQNPDSLTFARVADALMQRGRIDEAIQLCEEGIRRHPYYATGHMVLGKCYLKKKLFDQAEKEFKRVLLFDPKYIAAHKYYGDLMREIGWENTCEMSYRKILQIDPFDDKTKAVVDDFNRKAK
ncbi:MAG: tetratricopeptide repeat protein, partial [candidate division KSB1 bacterium]|nr:tetratricopeptide repeat protein [candidate division KSB1 bacterium]